MAEHEETITHVVKALKEPVRLDPHFTRRVMSEIERLPVPGTRMSPLRSLIVWLRRRRTIRLSPLGALAMAAGVAMVVLAGSRLLAPSAGSDLLEDGTRGQPTQLMQFVLVAPGASSVALVGDFNDWNLSATPLVRAHGDGVWWVTVPLSPGRYRYSFVVDGSTWLVDPDAPAIEDEFGRENSLLTIGGA